MNNQCTLLSLTFLTLTKCNCGWVCLCFVKFDRKEANVAIKSEAESLLGEREREFSLIQGQGKAFLGALLSLVFRYKYH